MSPQPRADGYTRACRSLAHLGTKLRIRRLARGLEPRLDIAPDDATTRHSRPSRPDNLATALRASGIALELEEVTLAAVTAAILGAAASAAALLFFLLLAPGYLVAALVALVVVPVVLRELVLDFPDRMARKKAAQLAREAPEGTNLMVMSIRHEPSLSNSISFASTRRNTFSGELRTCVWRVLVGRHASFEESLLHFGSTWERYCPDIKAAINAMITASCENTEDGKRRALDRASHAIVVGTKRRIEEYALSLSFPSMLLFGVGILLPLMVGSFLPMTSWGVWSYGTPDDGLTNGAGDTTLQTAFVMNVLFPSIALVVGMGAVSRHPLETGNRRGPRPSRARMAGAVVVAAVSAIGIFAATSFLDGTMEAFAVLMAIVLPFSASLVLAGRRAGSPDDRRMMEADLENALFKTGASMVEGENFESALHRSSRGLGTSASALVEGLVFGKALTTGAIAARDESAEGNAAEALRLVGDAAGKDEQSAGLLAMDLAIYLRDLRDLESTLKTRLRPTISMMRTTAYALGPIVLGITFAIYLSLTSIVAPGASLMDAGAFFLILGVFLLEVNLVVTYFVWGIEGEGDRARLVRSAGFCSLCSSMVFSASALLAS